MNIAEIETKLRALGSKPFDPVSLAYDVLAIFDAPRATITKLQSGSINKGPSEGDVLWKGKLFFRPSGPARAAETIDEMRAHAATSANKPRIFLSSDGREVAAFDAKTEESVLKPWDELGDLFDILLPLAGIDRYEAVAESQADIKAAGRLARFYDSILERNPDWKSPSRSHALNLFITRVLFCLFAEDTGIFAEDSFSKLLHESTSLDGSDLRQVLRDVFRAMNRKPDERHGLPGYAKAFPYVNGGLFKDDSELPEFGRESRRYLVEASRLRWSEINPDIFGSMIQAVADPDLRGDLGMHYTSVPNIMKVIGPLFLDPLEREFELARDNPAALEKLLTRLYRIRVFDPACGSGNFLIISYREMRRLEMRIFERLRQITRQFTLPMSQVRLSQFYGIEYGDFAAETAKLSLWIAEHQLNKEFEKEIGPGRPALPLKDSGNVTRGNATRVDWKAVCPPDPKSETYIVGNPPYLGGKKLSDEQSEDMDAVGMGKMKQVDYVGCWFLLAARYIRATPGQFAFVATNSICQGEQVHLLWGSLLSDGMEIAFAHRSFIWRNSAANNAGVHCVVVGVRERGSGGAKVLFDGSTRREVKNIGPYLTDNADIIVAPAGTPLFTAETMVMGSNPVDGKHLILTKQDRDAIVAAHPGAARFIRRYMGGNDFMSAIPRFCLWIGDEDVEEAREFPPIAARLDACAAYRATAGRDAKKVAAEPHRFCYRTYRKAEAVIVPNTSSSNRQYVPVDFIDSDVVVNHAAFVIYDGGALAFALLSSSLHRAWLATVGGQLKSDYRYSVKLVYNTFPVPALSQRQKSELESCTWAIIHERENHPGSTLADLYDRKMMPPALLRAHLDLDATLETIYRGRPFRSDAERLEHLFKLYATRTGGSADKERAA